MSTEPLTPSGNPADFKPRTALHSVSYAGFWRGQSRLDVDEFLVKARDLGFDGVVLVAKRPHVAPLEYGESARKKLRDRLQELDLELVALAGYTDFSAGLDRSGIPVAEIQATYVGELARLASDLGCSMVRVFTGYERPGIVYDQQYASVLDGLRLAGRRAADYGVTIVVQNHHDIALHHDQMYWLLREVDLPNVMAGWDAWSPTLEGLSKEEIRRSVLRLKPFIVHTIAADYVRHPRFHYRPELTNYVQDHNLMRAVAMGDGVIDYDTFFAALREIGYRGFITYEMCEVLEGGGSIENLDRVARRFLDYAKRL